MEHKLHVRVFRPFLISYFVKKEIMIRNYVTISYIPLIETRIYEQNQNLEYFDKNNYFILQTLPNISNSAKSSIKRNRTFNVLFRSAINSNTLRPMLTIQQYYYSDIKYHITFRTRNMQGKALQF